MKTKTIRVITYTRKDQNREGAKIDCVESYFKKLMSRTGDYIKAKEIMKERFNINFFIEVKEIEDGK